MKIWIENLQQGTPAWLDRVAKSYGASEYPAACGVSKYQTREELLAQKCIGAEEPGSFLQKIYDAGHEVEDLLVAYHSERLGEEFSAVTYFADAGLDWPLRASLDGQNFTGDLWIECKTINEEIRAAFAAGAKENPLLLPEIYRLQMSQQAIPSRGQVCIFCAGRAERDDGGKLVLVEHLWCEYTPERALMDRCVPEWTRFEADRKAWKPKSAPSVVIPDDPGIQLPALYANVSGQLAVDCNVRAFEPLFRRWIAEKLIRAPETDQDFANLEAQIKTISGVEAEMARIRRSLECANPDIAAALESVKAVQEIAAPARIGSEKLVKSAKDAKKKAVIDAEETALRQYVQAIAATLGQHACLLPMPACNFVGAIKGLKTIASCEEKAGAEKLRAMAAADAQLGIIKANLTARETLADGVPAEAVALMSIDLASLALRECAVFAEVFGARVASWREQERRRAEAEERARIAAVGAAAQAIAPEVALAGENIAAAVALREIVQVADAAANELEPAALELGKICERIGVTMTANFVAQRLGIVHRQQVNAAKLYSEGDYRRILAALQDHIGELLRQSN